jgi:hypothetical protein
VQLFAEVNYHLADQGITLRSGTLANGEGANAMCSREPPNSIDAPSSTKNKAGARDPEMSSTQKGNQWYLGSEEDQKRRQSRVFPRNAHIGVDADSGIAHSLYGLTD